MPRKGAVERARDRGGRRIGDAGVALERVAEVIVGVGQGPTRRVQRGEQLVGVIARALLA